MHAYTWGNGIQFEVNVKKNHFCILAKLMAFLESGEGLIFISWDIHVYSNPTEKHTCMYLKKKHHPRHLDTTKTSTPNGSPSYIIFWENLNINVFFTNQKNYLVSIMTDEIAFQKDNDLHLHTLEIL